MVAVPALIPVTMPELTSATLVRLPDHEPPPNGSLNANVEPEHTEVPPEMVPATGATSAVRLLYTLHPVVNA